MSYARAPHRLRRGHVWALLGLAALAASQMLAPPVRADAVMPPPQSCPPGAVGCTGHMGPYCAPTSCDVVADCDIHRVRRFDGQQATVPSFECRAAGLCIRRQTAHFGHGHQGEIDKALGACARDEDCPDGVACAHASRCVEVGAEVDVAPDPVPSSLTPRAASCGAAAGASALVLILMGATLGGLGLRRARAAQARGERVRAVLESGGAVRHRELFAIVRSEAALDRALGPVAARLRVEAGEDGELEYALHDAHRDRAREDE